MKKTFMKKTMTRWWLLHWLILIRAHLALSVEGNNKGDDKPKGVFSPRMDYDQWKPIGRGDPLKNDPTYDYVPPVLDRVHYWIEPSQRKPDPPLPGENQKTEILLLGVTSKKPSTGVSVADSRKDAHDNFLKFVDGPKFANQRIARPNFSFVSSYYPSNLFSKNKSQRTEQRIPYTMLMPPPMITKKVNPTMSIPIKITTSTTTAPTVSSTSQYVTIQPSNLVYQSSSFGGFNEWNTESPINLTPNPPTFNSEIVFQKHLQPPSETFIQLPFATQHNNFTKPPLLASSSDHNINYVTPPPLIAQEVMHKGQVSDDNLDISNTYVKFGKSEAQVHSTAIDNLPAKNTLIETPELIVFPHITQMPLTMQTLQTMQSMQPPPVTTSPVFKKTLNPVLEALENERVETTTEIVTTMVPTTTPTSTTTTLTTDPLFKHYKQPTEPLKGPLYLIIQGHSKVKTYGSSKQFHGIRLQETNEITDDREEVPVKHLHHNFVKIEEPNRQGRSGDIQTLKHVIQTGLGALDFGNIQRRKDDVKETELQAGYKVGEGATSEKYRKGYVEEARKLIVD